MDGGDSTPTAGGSGPRPAADGGPKRRPRDMLRPLVVPPGHAYLRLLCHVAHIGGVIGKSGAVVKQLEQETGARIRIDDVVPDCEERVVHVVGPERPRRSVPVGAPRSGAGEEAAAPGAVEVEVSAAQEGVLRVFERALGMAEEVDGRGGSAGTGVTCKLLAAMGQVGLLMGKGGKNIDKVRKETGARIRVLSPVNLPACASPSDEVVQITGDVLAVKKALVAICDCLQNNPSSDKAQNVNRNVTAPKVTISDVRGDFSHRHSFPVPATSSSIDYRSPDHQAAIGVDRLSMFDHKRSQEKVLFRLLCSNDKIGGVIGKGGTIIKALENETGTSIDVGAPVAESEERVITISASESPESQYSPAQNAVVRVFNRSVEVGVKKGLDSGLDKSVISRLLILQNQAGCLMGRGGAIISEMRKSTSTAIRIFAGDQVPKCAADNEEVVQILGELTNVQNALFYVTGRLRDNLFSAKMPKSSGAGLYSSNLPEVSSYTRNTYSSSRSNSSAGLSQTYDPRTSLAHSMGNLGLSNSVDHPPSLMTGQGNSGLITDGARVLPAFRGGVELGSGSKTAVVTNTTVEIAVAEHLIKFVYGENSTNLNRIRQISGAKVVVHDPVPGSHERTVIISGNPDQALAAQSLLQAFILGGRSSSNPHP